MVQKGICLYVNGEVVTAADAEMTLLQFLRGQLGLISVRDGCARGQCGSCTVVVNGKARKACTLKMGALADARVETVEGLAKDGVLHPLQAAFIKLSAFQCGFCTGGLLMAAKALLDETPNPGVLEVRRALKPNICRCTGYKKVVEAVLLAAAALRGEAEIQPDSEGGMGARAARSDAYAKVTGQKVFTDDYPLNKPLYAKFKFCGQPHAKVLHVDISAAQNMPGVAAVLLQKDIPGRKIFGQGMVPQQPVIAGDVVRFVGDPVAVVYAESENQAAAAAEAIQVELEALPIITSPEEALAEGAVPIHPEGNLLKHHHTHKGDIQRGFAQSDVIVEGDFETPFIDHGYLEPDAAHAWMDEEGRLVVAGSVQNPMGLVRDLCASLNLPEEKVVVLTRPCGGAFGGREEPSVHIQAGLGALVTGRPVRMVFTREELNLFSTKRHAMKLHYKIGATKEGKLQAMQVNIVGDTGAYMSSGEFVLFRSCVYATGPYEVPNAWVDTYAVYTNNVPGASMRGFGSPQPCAALETLLDELAEKCGLSPYELRLRNALETGKQTLTGHVVDYACGYKATLEAVQKALQRDGLPAPSAPGKKVGVGLASGMKNVGLGSGSEDAAWAQMKLCEDGRLLLMAGGVECGQGHDTAVLQIAAEALGLPLSRLRIAPVNSAYSLDGGITTASRLTFVSGNACKTVALNFKNTLLAFAARHTGRAQSALELCAEGVRGIGEEAGFALSFEELAKLAAETGEIPYEKYYYVAPATAPMLPCSDNPSGDRKDYQMHFSYCYATQAAVVEVDEASGAVEVLKVYAASDVGRAVNPALVEGQIEGGVAMGIGYALSEEFKMENGQVASPQLKDLGLPKITEIPYDIEAIVIEDVHPFGPFGAKGMGELPMNATPPAILNAVYNAAGVRCTKLPLRAGTLKTLLENRGKAEK